MFGLQNKQLNQTPVFSRFKDIELVGDLEDMEVWYSQAYIDGVDFVFINSLTFHGFQNNIERVWGVRCR